MSNIEEDIQIVKRYLENSSYKEKDSNFFKNGGWEIVDLEIPQAMSNIIKEREQNKKRIKELEEENGILEFQNKQVENYVKELKKYNKTISDRIVEYKKDSISKQKVKDFINKLKLSGGSNGKDNVKNLVRELAIEILEELLEDE